MKNDNTVLAELLKGKGLYTYIIYGNFEKKTKYTHNVIEI